ncbi:MAG: NYN domain-containing protein [Pirellulales bacterium]
MQPAVTRLRAICYVDGFNLYYGLREAALRHCYWLNIRDVAVHLVRAPLVLEHTKYFTARVSGKHRGDSLEKAAEREAGRVRQTTFLEALGTVNSLEIIEGRYQLTREYCRACKAEFRRPEEKMTDVRIATEMLTDAFLNRFDVAVLLSGDSDLVPPIAAILDHFPQKRVIVAFPPCRESSALKQIASSFVKVWPRTLEKCQLPRTVVKANGVELCRPAEWQ